MQGFLKISKVKHENERKSVAFSRPAILEIQAPKTLRHKAFRKIAKNIFRNFQEFLVGVNLRSIVDPLVGSKIIYINAKKTAQQTVSGLLCRLHFG